MVAPAHIGSGSASNSSDGASSAIGTPRYAVDSPGSSELIGDHYADFGLQDWIPDYNEAPNMLRDPRFRLPYPSLDPTVAALSFSQAH